MTWPRFTQISRWFQVVTQTTMCRVWPRVVLIWASTWTLLPSCWHVLSQEDDLSLDLADLAICATCWSQWRLLKKKLNFLSWENDDCRTIMNVWGKLFSNKPMSTHGQRDWWLVSNVPFGHLYNIRNVAVWQYMSNINVMLNLKQPKVTFEMLNHHFTEHGPIIDDQHDDYR